MGRVSVGLPRVRVRRPDGVDRGDQAAGPETEPGFVPAHVWLARWYLEGASGLDPDQARALADQHLQLALQMEPQHAGARALRGYQSQRSGRWDEAIRDLESVVKRVPEQGLGLAKLYASQGRSEAATHEARKVVDLFEGKAADGATLDAQDYQIWSSTICFWDRWNPPNRCCTRGCCSIPNTQHCAIVCTICVCSRPVRRMPRASKRLPRSWVD